MDFSTDRAFAVPPSTATSDAPEGLRTGSEPPVRARPHHDAWISTGPDTLHGAVQEDTERAWKTLAQAPRLT